VPPDVFHIVLGCFGRADDGFVSCGSIENVILEVGPSLHCYSDVMEYLDGCQLFDRPVLDYNAVRHFIFNMQSRFDQVVKKLWTEKQFTLYQKFVIDHKDCGVFIRLELSDEQ
jgi:hypothetical protein